jgi:hypothetical protein
MTERTPPIRKRVYRTNEKAENTSDLRVLILYRL